MPKVWIFDTETTSTKDDREIIEAAWIEITDEINRDFREVMIWPSNSDIRRYKPERSITCGSMAIHHIVPSDVEDCPPSSSFSIPEDVDYIVGHNIDFDWEAAGSPDHVKRICTDAMSRWVWQEADSYSQSGLLYMLCEPEQIRHHLKSAHNAKVDVMNNAILLSHILGARPELTSWDQLYGYSEACRIPRTCPFHQYRDVPLDELAELDPGYCEWMLRQHWLDRYLRIAVGRALNKAQQFSNVRDF